jgi:hypothetical protein
MGVIQLCISGQRSSSIKTCLMHYVTYHEIVGDRSLRHRMNLAGELSTVFGESGMRTPYAAVVSYYLRLIQIRPQRVEPIGHSGRDVLGTRRPRRLAAWVVTIRSAPVGLRSGYGIWHRIRQA